MNTQGQSQEQYFQAVKRELCRRLLHDVQHWGGTTDALPALAHVHSALRPEMLDFSRLPSTPAEQLVLAAELARRAAKKLRRSSFGVAYALTDIVDVLETVDLEASHE